MPRRDAVVPGDAHLDLMREGILPDLYVGMDLDHAAWVERKDWWYFKEFDTPADLGGRHAILVFHGLDTFGTVWLNGEEIGSVRATGPAKGRVGFYIGKLPSSKSVEFSVREVLIQRLAKES